MRLLTISSMRQCRRCTTSSGTTFATGTSNSARAEVTAEEATPQRAKARTTLVTVLEQALRLLHPFMPYITEDLWLRLPGTDGKSLLHASLCRSGTYDYVGGVSGRSRTELIDERC